MDTSSQPQEIPLHNGVGSGFCGAYPEDDDQFTYRLCLRNTTTPSSHNECEAFSTCCECGSCDDPPILALTNITSQTTYDRYNRQICNFSVTSEVIVSCHGRRNGVPNAAFQDVSIHVVQQLQETKPSNTMTIVSVVLGSVLGLVVIVLVVAMIAITIFKRILGKYRAQTDDGREERRVVDVGEAHRSRREERNPVGPGMYKNLLNT